MNKNKNLSTTLDTTRRKGRYYKDRLKQLLRQESSNSTTMTVNNSGDYQHMKDPMESRPSSLTRMGSQANSSSNFQEADEEEVYIVKQEYGYFSYLFGLVQTVILIIMMWQCRVAPLNINPMIGPYPGKN